MIDLEQLKKILIVWSAGNDFTKLGMMINEEMKLSTYIDETIKSHGEMLAERENQIRIQTEKLNQDSEVDKQARKEKIEIIQNQKKVFEKRIQFFNDIRKECI